MIYIQKVFFQLQFQYPVINKTRKNILLMVIKSEYNRRQHVGKTNVKKKNHNTSEYPHSAILKKHLPMPHVPY